MRKKVLFLDRDGTIIREPSDYQIDSLEKLSFIPYAISSLKRLVDAGFELVMVSNQDGLGSDRFPETAFHLAQNKMLEILAGEGVSFAEVCVNPHFPHENSPLRKPAIGMLLPYLGRTEIDREQSAVIGDRATDAKLAENLNVASITLKSLTSADGDAQYQEGLTATTTVFSDWRDIADHILNRHRTATITRETKETDIAITLNLDGNGKTTIDTGLHFLNHMLEQLGKHSCIDLSVKVAGDLHIDEHHTVEDTAIALGEAFKQALGDKRGIGRYGFVLPMDESLATCALDFSNRPYLVFTGTFSRDKVGDLPTELVHHFFRSFADHAGLTLNLSVTGDNDHHKIEACFKALAKSLKDAIKRSGTDLPSTKGIL